MRTVHISRAVDGIQAVNRYPACSDTCASAVASRISQPVYSPRIGNEEGALIAVRRPARTRIGPSEVSGACSACGSPVKAVLRSGLTELDSVAETDIVKLLADAE